MRVLLASVGTRGDVQPPLALAQALKARGHHVTLAAPPDFGPWIEAHGVPALALGMDFASWAEANGDTIGSVVGVMREVFSLLAAQVQVEFALLGDQLAAHDVIVTSSLVSAGPSVAAAAGKPHIQLVFVPTTIPTAAHAPFFVPWRTLPRAANALAWWATHLAFNRPLRDPINHERRRLGLPPIGHVLEHLMAGHVLLAADEVLTPPCATRAALRQVPALVLDDVSVLSPDLEAFLEVGAPPTFFGFGSMPEADPDGVGRAIGAAMAEVGGRAVVAKGAARGLTPSADLWIAGPEPHGRLFPRCAGIVHHGGVGTTTTALRAGVPQLVMPHTADQPDWGHRVWQAGLGPRPLPRRRLTGPALAAALRELRAPALAAAAAGAATQVATAGNAAAVAAVEAIVASSLR